MAIEEDLRLAWQADRDGRKGMRDALLTLAVAESGPHDAAWVDRAWRRLVTSRSDHLFARFPNRQHALSHPEVLARLKRLREIFPPARVQRLLNRAEVIRGTYTGRRGSLAVVVEELIGPGVPVPSRAALADSAVPKQPLLSLEAAPVPGASGKRAAAPATAAAALARLNDAETSSLVTFYLTVLLAMAVVLASTLKAADLESKAA